MRITESNKAAIIALSVSLSFFSNVYASVPIEKVLTDRARITGAYIHPVKNGLHVHGGMVPRKPWPLPPAGHVDIDVVSESGKISQTVVTAYHRSFIRGYQSRRVRFNALIPGQLPENSHIRITPHMSRHLARGVR